MNNIINFYIYYRKLSSKDGDLPMINDITIERKKEIEEKVNNLISDYDFSKSPSVDIVGLVKKDKFEVKPTIMPIETTGCIFVDDNGNKSKRLITVNRIFKNPDNEEDVVFKKSRFITAHEYGHFILHKSSSERLYAHRDSDHRCEPQELEADYFARSILMPLDVFKVCYELACEMSKNDIDFVEEILSKMFRVTRKKVKLRINDLSEL